MRIICPIPFAHWRELQKQRRTFFAGVVLFLAFMAEAATALRAREDGACALCAALLAALTRSRARSMRSAVRHPDDLLSEEDVVQQLEIETIVATTRAELEEAAASRAAADGGSSRSLSPNEKASREHALRQQSLMQS